MKIDEDDQFYCDNHERFVKVRFDQVDIVCDEDNCHWIIATMKEGI